MTEVIKEEISVELVGRLETHRDGYGFEGKRVATTAHIRVKFSGLISAVFCMEIKGIGTVEDARAMAPILSSGLIADLERSVQSQSWSEVRVREDGTVTVGYRLKGAHVSYSTVGQGNLEQDALKASEELKLALGQELDRRGAAGKTGRSAAGGHGQKLLIDALERARCEG